MLRPQLSDLRWTRHGFVTPASLDDVRSVAQRLRGEDRRELEEIGGRPASELLTLGLLSGDPCVTLWSPDELRIAILTVIRTGSSAGAIALSGTADIERFSKAFLRGSRECLEVLHRDYDLLFNVCDARNVVHRRWLKWLGFREIRAVEGYGAEGITVIEFAKLRSS